MQSNGKREVNESMKRCTSHCDIIGYCTCMGIYCVERLLLAELSELARATTPKERVQHNNSHTSAITFLLYTLILFYIISCDLTSFL